MADRRRSNALGSRRISFIQRDQMAFNWNGERMGRCVTMRKGERNEQSKRCLLYTSKTVRHWRKRRYCGHPIVEEMSRVEKKRKRQNRRLIFYFSLVEMMTWITIAGWGFIVPFLQETGLNSTQVGITIACNGLMGVIAPPFWGKLADKIRSARKVFIPVSYTHLDVYKRQS